MDNLLKKINDSEKKAEQIISKATKDADKLILDANSRFAVEKEKLMKKLHDKREQKIKDLKKKLADEISDIKKKESDQIAKIEKSSKPKIEKASEEIVDLFEKQI